MNFMHLVQNLLWTNECMKHFATKIDHSLHMRLRLFAAHTNSTVAEAGARAMASGIPHWVGAVPPSEARAMARANTAQDDGAQGDNGEVFDPIIGE